MIWKIKLDHSETVEIEVGQKNQIIGQNVDKIKKIQKVLGLFFNKKKYDELVLRDFGMEEPWIQENNELISKSRFNFFSYGSMEEIYKELELGNKKILDEIFDNFLNSDINITEISNQIDTASKSILFLFEKYLKENIFNSIEMDLEFSKKLMIDYLKKNTTINYYDEIDQRNISYFDKITIIKVFINLIKYSLSNSGDRILLVVKDSPNFLSKKQYLELYRLMSSLSDEFPNFYFMMIHSDVEYLSLDENSNITILNDVKFEVNDLEFLYERLKFNYPSKYIEYEDFFETGNKWLGYIGSFDIPNINSQYLVSLIVLNKLLGIVNNDYLYTTSLSEPEIKYLIDNLRRTL
ncbi:CRISPR-associated protein Csn2-St [Vagococcus xieshaowenii]|uniref:Uncharacterized protein n=1 Tax=Vagococcus xieshaowenii TaxID=2562451 RepID=A0AAJ5JQB7_9ENTE|nr:CRISPR-associated protein Csn2-St [Vagococcus xieshaowenii]QCA28729.1 hypothetical protein E4Z98_05140 [Vagococcus xieshaowenii]TFZ40463.1 hypothetical protein E4031_06635 [Vagococcus xieshaowenii]